MTQSIDDARRRYARNEGNRVPPNDLAAERALLGTCLYAPDAVVAALELVGPEYFYSPAHGHIFAAISDLHDHGEPVEVGTVAAYLRRLDLLDVAGGANALIDLLADGPSGKSGAKYARIVAEMATYRRMIGVASEIAEMGYAMPEDIGAAVERAQRMTGELESPGRAALAIRSFDEIDLETVEYVWEGRIPRGMVTIVAGDPGVGKSFVVVALAAGLSVGATLPGAQHQTLGPVGTLLVNYEDAAGVTLKQRVTRCGADERHVHYLDGVVDGIGTRPFRPDDARLLELELVRRPDVGMVVIDPVGSLLAGKLDMARDNEVRGALLPLVDMARRTNTAVVAVMHLRKEDAERVIYRVGGSVGGFVGLARSVLLVGKEQTTGRRAIAHAKCNVGPEAATVEYTIGGDGSFVWNGVAEDLSAEQLLASGHAGDTKREAAGAWLLAMLDVGPVLRSRIIAEAKEQGYSYATLRRAYDDIGADSVQERVAGKVGRGPASWFIP